MGRYVQYRWLPEPGTPWSDSDTVYIRPVSEPVSRTQQTSSCLEINELVVSQTYKFSWFIPAIQQLAMLLHK